MPKRTLHGVVVSDKQEKTVVVRVERRFTHPTMKKTIRRSKKYHAHDEKNDARIGDIVRIEVADSVSPDLEVPKWIVYLCIPLGSYLMCFRFCQVAWAYFWTGELPHHDPAHVEGVVESHQAAADVAAEELAR